MLGPIEMFVWQDSLSSYLDRLRRELTPDECELLAEALDQGLAPRTAELGLVSEKVRPMLEFLATADPIVCSTLVVAATNSLRHSARPSTLESVT